MSENRARRLLTALPVRLVLASLVLVACWGAGASASGASEPSKPRAPMAERGMSPPAAPAAEPQLSLTGRRICIDPGHDARWTPGASAKGRSGAVPRHPIDQVPMHEHELTLSVGRRLQALLEADGAAVCLTRKTREEGGGLQQEPVDFTGDGRARHPIEDVPELMQPRIDWANDFGAEILLSIHFNGSGDPSVRGSEVYYTDAGPTAETGRRLSAAVLAGLISDLESAGHRTVDRGLRSDRYQRYSEAETARLIATNAAAVRTNGHDPAKCGECYRLVTLGNNPMSPRAGRYVAVLVEVEFLSSPDVVEGLMLRPDSLDIIAAGLYEGLKAYFAEQ